MKKTRILFASLAGSVIEWYDFYLYGTATGLVFTTLFFPSHDPAISLLLAFVTFGAGYAARPLGSILFGHMGDKLGRKAALMFTLLGMGGSSMLIGVLPTYQQVGLLAPIILVVLRLIQGISLGGEWGGAILLATESAPKGVRGLYGSIPQLGVPIGLVAGSFSFTLISSLITDAQFMSWGWRIPFLLSGVLIALAIWVRSGVEETPEFKQQKESGDLAGIPILETLKHDWKNVLKVIGLKIGDGFFNVFIMSYMLVYTTMYFGYERDSALTALTIGCVVMLLSIPLFGYLSDYINRKIIYVGGLALLFVLAIPYFSLIGRGIGWLYLMQAIVLGLLWGAIFSTQGTFFSELFPAKVRYTGLSVGYQVSAAIAGFGPLMWTSLAESFGPSPWVFGSFMMAGLAISLILCLFIPYSSQAAGRDHYGTKIS